MRHQFATVHELARIELLAGLPGQALAPLAERMERRTLAPGEGTGEDDALDRFTVVISGLVRSAEGTILRPGQTVGGVTPARGSVTALMPSVVATCDQATFDELIKPRLGEKL